jgi:hypothetical protein
MKNDSHYNLEGNRLAAESIGRFLTEEGLIPEKSFPERVEQ